MRRVGTRVARRSAVRLALCIRAQAVRFHAACRTHVIDCRAIHVECSLKLRAGVNRNLTRIAMAVWATMLAHQIAAKAFRDATFLSAWPAAALPMMTVATAVLTGVLARIAGRCSDRYPSAVVVACGLGFSAAGHIAEWALYGAGCWNAVVVYLHLAGVTGLLLSGFWSLTAERFDPEGARRAYGRIGAAGTV